MKMRLNFHNFTERMFDNSLLFYVLTIHQNTRLELKIFKTTFKTNVINIIL